MNVRLKELEIDTGCTTLQIMLGTGNNSTTVGRDEAERFSKL